MTHLPSQALFDRIKQRQLHYCQSLEGQKLIGQPPISWLTCHPSQPLIAHVSMTVTTVSTFGTATTPLSAYSAHFNAHSLLIAFCNVQLWDVPSWLTEDYLMHPDVGRIWYRSHSRSVDCSDKPPCEVLRLMRITRLEKTSTITISPLIYKKLLCSAYRSLMDTVYICSYWLD